MRKYLTWKQKILIILEGTEKKKYWFTHKRISEELVERGLIEKRRDSITCFLSQLVMGGYVERSLKPSTASRARKNNFEQKEYVYRRTDKKYTPFDRVDALKNQKWDTDNAEVGFRIWCNNPKLPRWYRKMML